MTPRPTAADYAAIAVAPVLIFVMISSLANFLVLALYDGDYLGRVSWTLLFFTMGVVAIARLAIERDRSYALGYAAILGLAAFVVMYRFVGSPIFSAFMLFVIGYLADVIVRDCTLIDESIDASGRGLVDSGRLFFRRKQVDPNDAEQPDAKTDSGKSTGTKKVQQPGRTIMYLALAALPLFGFGQFLISDPSSWRTAQFLLGLYLFASLSLLVTTSFLGLRRYLRQRNAEMPKDVAISWLVGGLGMIAVVLLIAFMAPMPGQALVSVDLPSFLDASDSTTASRFGWGREAAVNSRPEAAGTTGDDHAEGKEVQGETPVEGAPPGSVSQGQRDDGPAGSEQGSSKSKSQGGGNQSGDSKSQSQSSGDRSPEQSSKSPSSSQSQSSQSQSSQSQQRSDSRQSGNQREGDQRRPAERAQNQAEQAQNQRGQAQNQRGQAENQSDRSTSEDGRRQSPTQDSSQSPQSSRSENPAQRESPGSQAAGAVSNAASQAFGIIKILVAIVLAGIVIRFVYLHREALARWWNDLFARDVPTVDEVVEQRKPEASRPTRSFASFSNPIGVEKDARRVVVVTFQAFEAWTREHGAQREKDETPTEFLRRATKLLPDVSSAAMQVVEAYNRVVYGRGPATQQDVEAAQAVWARMKQA